MADIPDRIDVETVNGIAITMEPRAQRYYATINGGVVSLKSLSELRKRCKSTFEPTPVLLINSEPSFRWHHRSYYGGRPSDSPRDPDSNVEATTISGIHERKLQRGVETDVLLGNNTPGRSARTLGYSQQLYYADDALLAALHDIERRGRETIDTLNAEWTAAIAGARKVDLEAVKRGERP